ncbi:Hypothetical predicted protein [Pelobates cultripes]|uniref:Reverse transcriptase n=1 Tax=Pelobates cultripes TaxID=61616 RepID=A0AAD1TC26_PELCU|nr:Hypothetical predicted protein [Pelobates cultripes]
METLEVNIFKRILSISEVGVLKKGLDFVPSFDGDKLDLNVELYKFFRTLHLKVFFSGDNIQRDAQNNDNSRVPGPVDLSKRKNKSKFTTPATNPMVETFIKLCQLDLSKIKWSQKGHSNLTKEEWSALNTLKRDDSIIVHAADKGGAIVVMDTDKYEEEALAQLSNQTYYRKLSGDPTENFHGKIHTITLQALDGGLINKIFLEFLNISIPQAPFLYLLPKSHNNILNPPGRPIVSGCGSLLQPLAQYVDAFLQILVVRMKSYTWDMTYFLGKLNGLQSSYAGTVLCMMDVCSFIHPFLM